MGARVEAEVVGREPESLDPRHLVLDIRGLKRFAVERLPRGCSLKEALVTERDEVPAEEFLILLPLWLRLLHLA